MLEYNERDCAARRITKFVSRQFEFTEFKAMGYFDCTWENEFSGVCTVYIWPPESDFFKWFPILTIDSIRDPSYIHGAAIRQPFQSNDVNEIIQYIDMDWLAKNMWEDYLSKHIKK